MTDPREGQLLAAMRERQRSTQTVSVSNLVARNLGSHASGYEIKRWHSESIDAMPLLDEQRMALKANLAVMRCLDDQIQELERAILTRGTEGFLGLPMAARG